MDLVALNLRPRHPGIHEPSITNRYSRLIHSALLALVAGIGLVGIRYGLHSQDPAKWSTPDNAKITIKFLIVAVILTLGFKFKKKVVLPRKIWGLLLALTVTNIAIAVWW